MCAYLSGTVSKWAGYAASLWMFVFAAMSFYWGLGGTAGLETVAIGQEFAGNSWFIAVLWLTGGLKLIGGVLALALVQSWGQLLSRRLVLVFAWAVSCLLVVHGVDFVVQGALTDDGFITSTTTGTWTATHWQTFVWGPWWLLGGLCFSLATWSYQRRTS